MLGGSNRCHPPIRLKEIQPGGPNTSLSFQKLYSKSLDDAVYLVRLLKVSCLRIHIIVPLRPLDLSYLQTGLAGG